MQKNISFFMISKKIKKNVHYFAINLWELIAHKFMITFCHKLMQKNCINLCKKNISFFMIPKKIIKNSFRECPLTLIVAGRFSKFLPTGPTSQQSCLERI